MKIEHSAISYQEVFCDFKCKADLALRNNEFIHHSLVRLHVIIMRITQ